MDEFLNKIKILRSIDGWEIACSGTYFSDGEVSRFLRDPYMQFMSMPPRQQAALWEIIERRHAAGQAYRKEGSHETADKTAE